MASTGMRVLQQSVSLKAGAVYVAALTHHVPDTTAMMHGIGCLLCVRVLLSPQLPVGCIRGGGGIEAYRKSARHSVPWP